MIMVIETCSHVIMLIMTYLLIDYGNDNEHSIMTPTWILALIIITYISYIEIFYYILNTNNFTQFDSSRKCHNDKYMKESEFSHLQV